MLLAQAPPFTELILRAAFLGDMYYQFQVPRSRQAIELGSTICIPSSTVAEFRNEALFGAFLIYEVELVNPPCPRFCQPAMTAITMEDLNGVTAAQWAHVHGLTSAGLLPSHFGVKRRWLTSTLMILAMSLKVASRNSNLEKAQTSTS